MNCGPCGNNGGGGSTTPDINQLNAILKALILDLLNDGTLQAGLLACREGDCNHYLGKGSRVVLCSQLADLICDLITDGKICIPKIEALTTDCAKKTLTLSMSGGVELTADLSCLGGAGADTTIDTLVFDRATKLLTLTDTAGKVLTATIDIQGGAGDGNTKITKIEAKNGKLTITDSDNNTFTTDLTDTKIASMSFANGKLTITDTAGGSFEATIPTGGGGISVTNKALTFTPATQKLDLEDTAGNKLTTFVTLPETTAPRTMEMSVTPRTFIGENQNIALVQPYTWVAFLLPDGSKGWLPVYKDTAIACNDPVVIIDAKKYPNGKATAYFPYIPTDTAATTITGVSPPYQSIAFDTFEDNDAGKEAMFNFCKAIYDARDQISSDPNCWVKTDFGWVQPYKCNPQSSKEKEGTFYTGILWHTPNGFELKHRKPLSVVWQPWADGWGVKSWFDVTKCSGNEQGLPFKLWWYGSKAGTNEIITDVFETKLPADPRGTGQNSQRAYFNAMRSHKDDPSDVQSGYSVAAIARQCNQVLRLAAEAYTARTGTALSRYSGVWIETPWGAVEMLDHTESINTDEAVFQQPPVGVTWDTYLPTPAVGQNWVMRRHDDGQTPPVPELVPTGFVIRDKKWANTNITGGEDANHAVGQLTY